jgi:hypothetical protein
LLRGKPGIYFHYLTAFVARAAGLIGVKFSEAGQKIFLDIVEYKTVFVEQVVAVFTVPLQSVFQLAVIAFALNDQPDGIGSPAGLVGHAGRQEKHLTFADRNGYRLSVFLNADFNIALQLVKQFLCFVKMVVFSRIGASDNHHDVITGLVVQVFVSYGGFQQFAVFPDPLAKVERSAYHHGCFAKGTSTPAENTTRHRTVSVPESVV